MPRLWPEQLARAVESCCATWTPGIWHLPKPGSEASPGRRFDRCTAHLPTRTEPCWRPGGLPIASWRTWGLPVRRWMTRRVASVSRTMAPSTCALTSPVAKRPPICWPGCLNRLSRTRYSNWARILLPGELLGPLWNGGAGRRFGLPTNWPSP